MSQYVPNVHLDWLPAGRSEYVSCAIPVRVGRGHTVLSGLRCECCASVRSVWHGTGCAQSGLRCFACARWHCAVHSFWVLVPCLCSAGLSLLSEACVLCGKGLVPICQCLTKPSELFLFVYF